MLRISKIADYGTKIMLAMAESQHRLYAATELAELTHISLPTVSKVLKLLLKGNLLISQRGSQGGYQLAKAPQEITLAQIVRILDGDIAMTECEQRIGCCQIEDSCNVKDNWSVISNIIVDVLQNISLAQMSKPIQSNDIPLKFYQRASA